MDAPGQAALAIAIASGLIIFMDWVPTPLNRNILAMSVRERIPSTVIHGSLGALYVSPNLMRWTWIVMSSALWYSIVLAQGVRNWWLAYLFGIHSGEISPVDYQEHYSSNTRLLPQLGDHPVIPDVQQVLIHLSVLGAAVLSWLSFVALV
jgi:hypothetical protein